MEKLINVFKKNGVLYTKKEERTDKKIIIVSNDETIKTQKCLFGECEIQCCECGKFSKISKIQTYHFSKKHLCKKCSRTGERNPMYGKHLSEEAKKKLSEMNKGENNNFYGKHHSIETKKKISEKKRGKKTGKENPMYGINVYKLIEERDGKDRINEIKEKISKACKGEKNGFYGKKHSEKTKKQLSESLKKSEKLKQMFKSDEWKEKHRSGMLNSDKLKASRKSDEYRNKKRVQFSKCMELGNRPKVCFNPKACRIFDKIMEEKGVFIQHAMNGGEYMVEGLGYWLDGYDKENNVAYEYDERHHFINGELRESDKKRQKEIENKLKCKFIRIKDSDYED